MLLWLVSWEWEGDRSSVEGTARYGSSARGSAIEVVPFREDFMKYELLFVDRFVTPMRVWK